MGWTISQIPLVSQATRMGSGQGTAKDVSSSYHLVVFVKVAQASGFFRPSVQASAYIGTGPYSVLPGVFYSTYTSGQTGTKMLTFAVPPASLRIGWVSSTSAGNKNRFSAWLMARE
jgi:hypothetical protein